MKSFFQPTFTSMLFISLAISSYLAIFNILSLPPAHVVRLFQEVVTHPTRNGQHWRILLDEVLLPANLYQHALHLVGNLIVPCLLVPSCVAVHLVHTDADLLHAEEIDQT